MNGQELLTSGALSSLFLEGVKFVVRKWIVKDMAYDFPLSFYAIALPVLNAIMPFALVALGLQVNAPILTMDLPGALKYLLVIVLTSMVSLMTNTLGLKPVRNYTKGLEDAKLQGEGL